MATAALAFSDMIPVSADKLTARHAAWAKLVAPVLSPAHASPDYRKHMVRATLEFFADVDIHQYYAAVMPLEKEAIRQQAIMFSTKVQESAKKVKVIKTFGFKNKKNMNGFVAYQDRMHGIMFNKYSLNIKKVVK